MVDCAIKITKNEGPQGLFKGLVACQLKVVPAMALMFMSNEMLKKHFKV
jgi:hypothetical protein